MNELLQLLLLNVQKNRNVPCDLFLFFIFCGGIFFIWTGHDVMQTYRWIEMDM